MTVAIGPTPAPKTAHADPAPAPNGKDAKFAKLIDTADITGGPVDPPLEAQPAAPTPPADQSLEALLSALKVTLTPGAALLMPVPKKAGDDDKLAEAKDKAAKDGNSDPATALLAALNISPLTTQSVAKDLVSQARQAVDDVVGKAASAGAALLGLSDAAPAPVPLPPSIDLGALTAATATKSPDQPAPITAQLDRLIDTARDAAWLDRLSQDIAASAGAGDKMRFRMMPPNLGALDVSVERQAAGLTVSMTTHTVDARNLIADSRQQMVDSLKAQGVPLIQLSLQTAGEEQAGHRPPTFFNHLIEAAPLSGTDLAAQPVESTMAERVGRFA